MSFSWNIQKVDFYIDQIEEKGHIDLEGAIKEFQLFPWQNQLEEVEKREMTSIIPTISFVSDRGEKLGIWMSDSSNFKLYYENKSKCSYLSRVC